MTSCSHWHDSFIDILLTKAEGDEFLFVVSDTVLYVATALQFLQLHTVFVQPLAIGMSFGQLFLDLTIVVDLTLLCIDEQDLTWLQTAFAHHIARFEVHHTHLRGNHHHTTLGNRVSTGTQTVSIQHTTSIAAVAEQQCCRTVPRFH